jgi:energy-coupling factor transporter transmembrane protein EcfT
MVSSIDDIIAYLDGDGKIYEIDFRVKVLWILLTIITAVISLDAIFTSYLLISTIVWIIHLRSPIFTKLKRNKALVIFTFTLIITTFLFSSLNYAMMVYKMTRAHYFFFFARSVAIGFLTASVAIIVLSTLHTTKTIEMTAGRGPTLSILTFLSFRSVPLIAFHLNNVIDSQRARGLELEKLGVRSVLRGLKAILIPLLILLTGSIDRTSKALESRGINPTVKNKTSYIVPKLKKLDYFLIFYLIIQLTISIYLSLLFSPMHPTTTLTYTVFSQLGLI